MKKNSQAFNLLFIIIALGYMVSLGSCTPAKKVIYFENIQRDTTLNDIVNNNFELKIRRNDLLGINIISPDPVSTPLFNGLQSVATSSIDPGGSTGVKEGYLVDNSGNIEMYKLGAVRAEGLTRHELKQKLQTSLAPFLKDAVVSVRFLSNKVTILGEVNKPQVLTMVNEQLSLLEAIAQSGDLTFAGRRDNILVIRETEAGKQFKRLNLNDNSLFKSPFYYLKPDDVVYIEPTETKIKNAGQNQQMVSYIISGLSLLVTLLFYLLQ